MSKLTEQALALIDSGYEAPVIHDDCGEQLERVHVECRCGLLHFWCPACRFPFDFRSGS